MTFEIYGSYYHWALRCWVRLTSAGPMLDWTCDDVPPETA